MVSSRVQVGFSIGTTDLVQGLVKELMLGYLLESFVVLCHGVLADVDKG
jgi:hypothetical protein